MWGVVGRSGERHHKGQDKNARVLLGSRTKVSRRCHSSRRRGLTPCGRWMRRLELAFEGRWRRRARDGCGRRHGHGGRRVDDDRRAPGRDHEVCRGRARHDRRRVRLQRRLSVRLLRRRRVLRRGVRRVVQDVRGARLGWHVHVRYRGRKAARRDGVRDRRSVDVRLRRDVRRRGRLPPLRRGHGVQERHVLGRRRRRRVRVRRRRPLQAGSRRRSARPISCDATKGACFGACTLSSQCVAGQQCVNASCGKKMKGASCAKNARLRVGVLRRRRVLQRRLPGRLRVVRAAGSSGHVLAHRPGRRRSARRLQVDLGASSCGATGACDGFGGCAKYARGDGLRRAVVHGHAAQHARHVRRHGHLPTAGRAELLAVPVRERRLQRTTCTSDADCDAGHACVSGQCGPKNPDRPCAAGTECARASAPRASAATTRAAASATAARSRRRMGHCTPLAAGAVDSKRRVHRRGRGDAAARTAAATARRMSEVQEGTVCAPERCAANVYTPASTCSATGQCAPPDVAAVRAVRLQRQRCFNACTTDQDCVSPNDVQQQLVRREGHRRVLLRDPECRSTFCAQGVCCDTACSGACTSCALPGIARHVHERSERAPAIPLACAPIRAPRAAARTASVTRARARSTRRGRRARTRPARRARRRSRPARPATARARASRPRRARASRSSAATTCATRRARRTPTARAPAVCTNGSCGLKGVGKTCADATECFSGFCAQGVCCDGACAGTCTSCVLSGSLGHCANIANGGANPRGRCVDRRVRDLRHRRRVRRQGRVPRLRRGHGVHGVLVSGGRVDADERAHLRRRGQVRHGDDESCAPFLCNGPNNACGQTCATNNDCVSPNTCDMVNGICGKKPAGAPCATADQCTAGLSCTDGFCCTAASTGCGACKSCNGTGSCQNADGVACMVTDLCHVAGGTCSGGACSSAAISCDDGNPCTTDSCNPSTGCVHTNNTISCNDGNPCTQTDACSGGVCVGSNVISCPGATQCHGAQACDPSTGLCAGSVVANGMPCDDGNGCTVSDSCQGGVCASGTAKTCAALDQCHVAGTCDSSTGNCSNPTKVNGTGCNDGNACTTIDQCMAGSCVGMSSVICTASDQCHVAGTCNPGTGNCSNPAAGNGNPCSDGNACTQSDTCQGGLPRKQPVTCPTPDSCHMPGTCDGVGNVLIQRCPTARHAPAGDVAHVGHVPRRRLSGRIGLPKCDPTMHSASLASDI